MEISPDSLILWRLGPWPLSATLLFTWLTMGLLVAVAWLVRQRLSSQPTIPLAQNILESIVEVIADQIEDVTRQRAEIYLPFIGTLFLFIVVSNLLAVVPGFHPPTASLSTTAALAICVFCAVPIYGIRTRGLGAYLKEYLEPTPIMLPFHLISEISRTFSLAIRLFGNIMSGGLLTAILLSIAPLFLPVVMQLLELVVGLIQAYVFAVLALVYIASATSTQEELHGVSTPPHSLPPPGEQP